jgi:hypothetical protein
MTKTIDATPFDYDALPFHEIAEVYDLADEHERAGMRESLRKHGLLNPMWYWLWNGQWWLLEGRNRYLCLKEIGHKFVPGDFKLFSGTYEEAVEFVAAQNNHRRHHTEAQKTEIAKRYIAKYPNYSSRRLALLAGVSHTSINTLRKPPKEDPGYANLEEAWNRASYEQQERFVVAYRIDLVEMMRPGAGN